MATAVKKTKSMNMTEGTIWKQLIYFAFPLLIGNLFQQLYNTVDSVVVGNFVSTEALAAVGSVTPIINMLVGFFSGLATGAGVVISQFFGAQNRTMLHKSVHTTLLMTVGLGIIFTFVGIFMTPFMLNLMSTPEDVFDGAALYLKIYFGGVMGLMLYNMASGILRAVGDSKRPLYFLILSSLLNVVLDLAFVLLFKMGIAGVAIATIIAQFISAFLLLVVLARSDEDYKLVLRDLKIDPEILKKVIRIGLPAGLQMAVTSFSNVFVQSYINRFGSACMAGWTSYSKIDQFVLLPMQSLSLSATTFVGQNLGAGNLARAKKGTRVSLVLSVAITALLTVLLIAFSSQLLMLFNQDPEVLKYGNIFIRYLGPFYVICCANQIFAGSLRGAGDATGPMIIMLLSFVVFRQIYLFIGTMFIDSIIFVGLGYPVGWVVCSIGMAFHYFRGRWEKDYQITK